MVSLADAMEGKQHKIRFIEIPNPNKGNGLRYGAAVGKILRELESNFYSYDAMHSPFIENQAHAELTASNKLTSKQLFRRAFLHKVTRATLMTLNGIPIGVCMNSRWSKNQVSFWNFCITAEYRGKGYGKKLMQHSIDMHRKLGYKSMNLYVHAGNPNAQAMYEEFGFKPLQVEMHLTLEQPNVQ